MASSASTRPRATRPPLALCWGTVLGAPLATLIEAASRHAFDAITFTSPMYESNRAAGCSDGQLRRRLADAGLRVHAIEPLISPLPGIPAPGDVPAGFRQYFEITEDDCYRAAHAAGAETINLAHFGGTPVPEAALVDCLGPLALRARQHGVQLTLEFLQGGAIEDFETACRIVRAVGSPDLAVMFDTWHFARTGGTLQQLADLPPGLIGALQISDYVEPAPGTVFAPMTGRLLPGEGELALVEMLRMLLRVEPQLTVGVEVFSEELQPLPADEVARRVALSAGRVLAQTRPRAATQSAAEPGDTQY
ncbi:MAG: sugar phosphate isomerase/epimerase [Proteobacteria bacterium]|nr:sugar phosphate isomerase/epimerase [Pseudomonadota bacterium]